jgi:transposase
MSDGIEEVARRLVIGHKSDGRSVYDEAAKAELVAACARPGASVSRLARECGINANQLSSWVREHSQRRQQRAVAVSRAEREAFVAVPIEPAVRMPTAAGPSSAAVRTAPMGSMAVQARLSVASHGDFGVVLQPMLVGSIVALLLSLTLFRPSTDAGRVWPVQRPWRRSP